MRARGSIRARRELQNAAGSRISCGKSPLPIIWNPDPALSLRVFSHRYASHCRAGSASPSERYDAGMTKSKIAITLPGDQLARVHREVRAGRADSVSGYIAGVLAEHGKRESLRVLLRDLIEQYGEPAAEDIKWAKRALAPRQRG
jgi:hypothetical protein